MNNHKIQVSLRGIAVYILAALFLLYEMALQVSPSVMTSELMRDLHVDAAGLGLMAGFYFYSYTVMQIPAGMLYDRFSCRWMITFGIGICVLGALFFSTSQTAVLAASGRFSMGIGSAFAFIGVLVVAGRWFPLHYFAFLVGVAQFLAAIGAGGEVLLATTVSKIGWRETIESMVVVGGILTLFIVLIVRDYPKDHKPVKVEEKKSYGLKQSLGFVVGSIQTWWIALYAFACWAPIAAFGSLWGVPYLMESYGMGKHDAALATGMIWLGLAIAAPILGGLSNWLGRRCVLLNTCAATGFISAMAVIYAPHLPYWLLCIFMLGFGFATAGQILTFALVKDNNRSEVTATAIGVNNMAVVAGGALFQPLIGFLLRFNWQGGMENGVPTYLAPSYHVALCVVPLCFLLAWLASRCFIDETYCRSKY